MRVCVCVCVYGDGCVRARAALFRDALVGLV